MADGRGDFSVRRLKLSPERKRSTSWLIGPVCDCSGHERVDERGIQRVDNDFADQPPDALLFKDLVSITGCSFSVTPRPPKNFFRPIFCVI